MLPKRFIFSFIASLVIVTVVFVLGPRVTVDFHLKPLSLTADLDSYLDCSEKMVSNLKEHAKKEIVWADKQSKKRTEYAIVYLHGFTANKQEIKPVADEVAKHLHANLYYNRFTAHGQGAEEFADVSANHWLNDANESIAIGRAIGKKVIIIGTSMGGALAAWYAANFPENIAALILISPAVELQDKRTKIFLWPWGKYIARAVMGKYFEFETLNEKNRKYWTYIYRSEGLLPLLALIKETQNRKTFSKIKCPVLVLYTDTELDKTLDALRIKEMFEQLGTEKNLKKIVKVESATHHVLAGEVMSPQTTGKVIDTINRFLDEYLVR